MLRHTSRFVHSRKGLGFLTLLASALLLPSATPLVVPASEPIDLAVLRAEALPDGPSAFDGAPAAMRDLPGAVCDPSPACGLPTAVAPALLRFEDPATPERPRVAVPESGIRTPAEEAEILAASAPYVARIREASDAVRSAMALGLPPPDLPEIVVPVDIAIDGLGLDVPLLHIVFFGDVYVRNSAQVRFYGASLEFHHRGAGDAAQLFVQSGSSFELWDLYNYTFPVLNPDLHKEIWANGPSKLKAGGGDAINLLGPGGLNFALGAPYCPYTASPLCMHVSAEPGTAFAIRNSVVERIEVGIFHGSLHLDNSDVRASYAPFATTQAPTGPHVLERSRFQALTFGYVPWYADAPAVRDNRFTDSLIPAYLVYTADASFERNVVRGYTIYGAVDIGTRTRVLENDFRGVLVYGILTAASVDARIESNLVEQSSAYGIVASGATRPSILANVVRSTGTWYAGAAVVSSASPEVLVAENLIEAACHGVYAQGGSVSIDANTIRSVSYGVVASNVLPSVTANTIRHLGYTCAYVSNPVGVWLAAAPGNVDENLVEGFGYGVLVDGTSAGMDGNEILTNAYGIVASSAVVRASSNLVHASAVAGVSSTYSDYESVSDVVRYGGHGMLLVNGDANVTGTHVHDNRFAGVSILHSPVPAGETRLSGNLVERNGFGNPSALRGGIELIASPADVFRGNVMASNAFGLSIPYDSRGTIAVAENNWVNGYNVDGTVVNADQMYWLGGVAGFGRADCAAGFAWPGRSIDVSNGGSYAGVLNIQGIFTLYECDGVSIAGAVLPRNTHGVFAWAVGSLVVSGGLFEDNNVPYAPGLNSYNDGDPYIWSGAVFANIVAPLHVHNNTAHRSVVAFVDRNADGVVADNVATSSLAGFASIGSGTVLLDNAASSNGYGMIVLSGGNVLSRNVVTASGTAGVWLHLASPRMEDNLVVGIGGGTCLAGIPFSGCGMVLLSASPQILRNEIREVSSGLYLEGAAPTVEDGRIHNGSYGVASYSVSTPTFLRTRIEDHTVGISSSSSGLTLTRSLLRNDVGIVASLGSFQLEGTTIRSASGPVAGSAGIVGTSTSGSIVNTLVTGFATGIQMTASSATCQYCEISANGLGLLTSGGGSFSVTLSKVEANAVGGLRMASSAILTASNTNFGGNAQFAVRNDDPIATANALHNWWGSPAAPPSTGPDSAQGNVNKFPRLSAPHPAAGLQP